ncbi:MAG: PAS domain S-box protein [Pseudomonadota bacterium]
MNWAEIAYLDLAVTEYVRDHILQGDAVVIVERETLVLRWSNGVAAKWLGLADLGANHDEQALIVEGAGARQLMTALARPLTGKRVASARTSGQFSALTQMHLYPLSFEGVAQDALAVVAFAPPDRPEDHHPLHAALVGLEQDDASAAIVDAQGGVLHATANFETDRLDHDQRQELCDLCANEADRMVKRIVSTPFGQFAVGVGRLSDAPQQYLFVLMPSGSASSSVPTDGPILEDEQIELASPAIDESSQYSDVEADVEEAIVDGDRPAEESAGWSPARLGTTPIRFVWKTDHDGVFIDMSEEFATAVGPTSANVVGKSFLDIADELSLDPDGAIGDALKRGETWSGKTVLWPIHDTELRVPVDLAALPYYDRNRTFEGYRGFGIARMGDLVVDEGFRDEPDPAVWADDADQPEVELDVLADPSTVDEESSSSEDDAAFQDEPPVLASATIVPMRRVDDLAAADPETSDDETHNDPDLVITPLSTQEHDAFERIRAELAPASTDQSEPGDQEIEQQPTPPPYGLGPEALNSLPLALMIARDEDALYINRAFSELTGFEDVETLNKQGMSSLFGGPVSLFADQPDAGNDNGITLVHKDGSSIPSRSHLQRVPWMGRNALMFAFEPVSPAATTIHEESKRAEEHGEDANVGANESDTISSENAELRAILDTATDGVVTIDDKGDIRSMNAAATALFGYDTDALIGQSFSILFAHESQKEVLNYVQSMVSNGVANVLNEGREVTGQEAKGGQLKLFMTLGRLGESDGLCAVLRDITAWKQNEEALEEARHEAESASEMKSAFLAKVSHEIRTPLNAIIGFSEIMSEERFGPIGNEKYKDYLDDIKKSGRYVVDLVNDLLDISKIESGNQDLQFESVSLNETVSEVVDMLRPQANRNRIIVRLALDPDLPKIVADQRASKQITINLLSNAIRFTPEGGQVVVSTRYLKDGSVTLRFRDTGVGMTNEELEGALRPFKQVGANEDLRASGTGLGLPLTRALVEANRAEFEISSKPGEGTDVEIVFPAPRVLSQ